MILFKKRKSKIQETLSKYSNIESNKSIWTNYAKNWTKLNAEVENCTIDEQAKEVYIEYLGDEWGDKESVNRVIDDFIFPFITSDSVVAEIGCGGGRITAHVAPRVKRIVCFDISEEMLKTAQKSLHNFSNISYVLNNGQTFQDSFYGSFDFVYSFDVFVHLDLHTIWSYFKEIKKIINKDGLIFLHTSNLNAPDGWKRFEKQGEYRVEGHYFISPELVKILANKADFQIIKESTVGDNFYYKRDYLFILKNKQ